MSQKVKSLNVRLLFCRHLQRGHSRDVIGHVTIRFPIGHLLLFASSDSFSVRRTA